MTSIEGHQRTELSRSSASRYLTYLKAFMVSWRRYTGGPKRRKNSDKTEERVPIKLEICHSDDMEELPVINLGY